MRAFAAICSLPKADPVLNTSDEPLAGQKKTDPPYSQDDPVRRVAYQSGYPKSKALMYNKNYKKKRR
ncbi:hypothetical protein D1BOALGB6SA_3823 [Olavius sp. associated proteobacterium Delta 1]|nr:hypothetical protein D1BOALGB6SA_3823 [Olavius sp. associated proteobacterium Delta 1]